MSKRKNNCHFRVCLIWSVSFCIEVPLILGIILAYVGILIEMDGFIMMISLVGRFRRKMLWMVMPTS